MVGAPRGTFPGGLNLSDPDSPAVPHTGLLYSCSILPDLDTPCDGVRGDEDTLTAYLNTTYDNSDNDLLNPGGRLFDQRRNIVVKLHAILTIIVVIVVCTTYCT